MRAIAIDGPSGAGKSTIARAIARELGYIYVDTGALYRVVGLWMLRRSVPPRDARQVADNLEGLSVDLRYIAGEQRVFLNGEDVTEAIRENACSMAASEVSAHREVRAFLLELQRSIARKNDVVMDGRDIGTVVLPGADLKIFLTAAPEDRAGRRFRELQKKGGDLPYEEVLRELVERDYNDTHRDIAPLLEAPGAVRVDTTGNTLEQSIAQLVALAKEGLS